MKRKIEKDFIKKIGKDYKKKIYKKKLYKK